MIRATRCVTLIASLSALTAPAAFAAPGGNNAGAPSGSQRSSTAMSNTNSSISPDRDQGQDRAADRRSASGADHTNASPPVKPVSPKG
jgi:hypothetical protein